MRKLAPVFFSSILVVTSGTALALGDMHKNKKAPSTDNTSQTSTTPSSTGSSADTTANPNAVAPSPGSSTYDSINKDSTSPSANSGAAMSDSASAASAPSKAKKPGNAASTPDAKIQRDNNDETTNPGSGTSK
jgi:hypothetical protein